MADVKSMVQRALEDGLAHPHQKKFIAIEGELDLDELAEFVTDALVADKVISVYREQGRCDLCGCDSCEPVGDV